MKTKKRRTTKKKKQKEKYVLFTRNAFEVGNYLWILILEAARTFDGAVGAVFPFFFLFFSSSHSFAEFVVVHRPSSSSCVNYNYFLFFFSFLFFLLYSVPFLVFELPQFNMSPLCISAGRRYWSEKWRISEHENRCSSSSKQRRWWWCQAWNEKLRKGSIRSFRLACQFLEHIL